jgi:hypothetical protein
MSSLRPGYHAVPRYQLALEKDVDQGPGEYIRPYAIRALSGHSGINILDPERIAMKVPEGIVSQISGVFRVTEMFSLSGIMERGLQPGGKYKFSRLDTHFMAFFPTDPRNEYAQYNNSRKLHVKREKAKSNLMVISVQPQALWKEEVRLCLANGFLLTDRVLPATYIEAIFELEYDYDSITWKHQLFYHQLASKCIWRGCRYGQTAKVESIVDLICDDPSRRTAMIRDCEQNLAFYRECHRMARQRPSNW